MHSYRSLGMQTHSPVTMLQYQKSGRGTSRTPVRVPPQVHLSLQWWLSPTLLKGCTLLKPDCLVVTSDASLQGWGAHLLDQVTQGLWSPAERNQEHSIKAPDIEGEKLLNWVEHHTLSLRADHISGQASVHTDWLSREWLDPAEWHLHPRVFREIVQRFGRPLMDLFAMPQNTQLPRYCSCFPSAGVEGSDTLCCLSPPSLLYAFLPFPLIPKVIRKLLKEQVKILLIAPLWPHRAWYADMVSLFVSPPWTIPQHKVSLSWGVIAHPEPQWLRLTIWHLRGSC